MTLRSFSGTHDYNPEHVIRSIVEEWQLEGIDVEDHARDVLVPRITADLSEGLCPRCRQTLARFDGDRGAGSRLTPCRCVPICGPCGSDEANQGGGILGTGVSQFWRWPVRVGDRTKRANRAAAMFGPVHPAVLTGGSDGQPVMITDDGATPLVPRPMGGGWAEFGDDDDSD